MSFFGSMMGSLIGRAALPVVGIAGIGAYNSGYLNDLPIPGKTAAPSHFEMQARIIDVERACRLRYTTGGKLRQTEALDCTRAVEMLKRPDFVGYTVHKSERVTYSYYTPSGQSTLTGTLPRAKDASGRAYRKNDVITIRIDAKDPTKSEVI